MRVYFFAPNADIVLSGMMIVDYTFGMIMCKDLVIFFADAVTLPLPVFPLNADIQNDDHCWRLWHSPVVTWDGLVVPCCFDKDAQHRLVDLKKESFKALWHNKEYIRFHSEILEIRKNIDICANCLMIALSFLKGYVLPVDHTFNPLKSSLKPVFSATAPLYYFLNKSTFFIKLTFILN